MQAANDPEFDYTSPVSRQVVTSISQRATVTGFVLGAVLLLVVRWRLRNEQDQ